MIPVVYCGNKKVFEGIFLSATSMARRTKEELHINVFTMDYTKTNEEYEPISQKQIDVLDSAIKRFNGDSGAKLHDLSQRFTEEFEGGKNLKTEYTPYAFLRFFMDDAVILPYGKAIYLDADTMCCKDIKELWDIDIQGYEYGAVLDHMGRFWVNRRYCNSGVLLINLEEIRRTNLFYNCRKLLYKRWFKMPDQSALHLLAKSRLYLPQRFNEQRGIKGDTVIKHFNKGIKVFPFFHIYNIKQWHREAVHKKLKIYDFDMDYEYYDSFARKLEEDKI